MRITDALRDTFIAEEEIGAAALPSSTLWIQSSQASQCFTWPSLSAINFPDTPTSMVSCIWPDRKNKLNPGHPHLGTTWRDLSPWGVSAFLDSCVHPANSYQAMVRFQGPMMNIFSSMPTSKSPMEHGEIILRSPFISTLQLANLVRALPALAYRRTMAWLALVSSQNNIISDDRIIAIPIDVVEHSHCD